MTNQKTKFLLPLLAIVASLFISSCKKKDEAPAKYFTIDGVTKTLVDGVIELDATPRTSREGDQVYNHILTLFSEGIDFVGQSGTGDMVSINLSITSPSDLSGSYTHSKGTPEVMYFYSSFLLDIGAPNNGTAYQATSGTLIITKSGSNYTIELEGIANKIGHTEEKEVVVRFSGPIKVQPK